MLRGFFLATALVVAMPARAELQGPAELPPPDYGGQQYVDSRGCLFVRGAQDPGQKVWVPRVARDGQPMCGNPPSGQRVPVVGDGASVSTKPAQGAALPADAAPPTDAVAPSDFYVAVGSFAVPANADAAMARLMALNFPAVRGRVAGESDALLTVFAGPFADAEQARRALSDLTAAGYRHAMLIGP